ncbi:chaperone modulator CbpM [Bosea sp. UC22_33]|uniref:chaperone modulator CbpM n=1 Tax=Bosea sp. UC22_33 TaxID=3350165 RepID=UPI003672D30D
MIDQLEPTRRLHVDDDRLQTFIDRGWISPSVREGQCVICDVDVARAALIVDLVDDMGLNEEGVDLVLDLLDQLYGLRSAFGHLIDTLAVQPGGVRVHLLNDARRLNTLSPRRSSTFR